MSIGRIVMVSGVLACQGSDKEKKDKIDNEKDNINNIVERPEPRRSVNPPSTRDALNGFDGSSWIYKSKDGCYGQEEKEGKLQKVSKECSKHMLQKEWKSCFDGMIVIHYKTDTCYCEPLDDSPQKEVPCPKRQGI